MVEGLGRGHHALVVLLVLIEGSRSRQARERKLLWRRRLLLSEHGVAVRMLVWRWGVMRVMRMVHRVGARVLWEGRRVEADLLAPLLLLLVRRGLRGLMRVLVRVLMRVLELMLHVRLLGRGPLDEHTTLWCH